MARTYEFREGILGQPPSSWQSQFPLDVLHHHETRDPHVQHMLGTSTRSGFRRGCGRASWRPPSDLVDQVHVSGALSGACTGKGRQMANPRPTPQPENLRPPWPPGTSGNPAGYSRGRPLRGLKMIVGSFGIPWGLTPPGYELAPHTGLDKAPPRTRDEGRLDARATSHWSRIATQHRSYLPGAVTSA